MVVAMECSDECAQGARCLVPRFAIHGGPFSWGCSVCFGSVSSRQWRQQRKTQLGHVWTLFIAHLQSLVVPTVHNIRQHTLSGLHGTALNLFSGAETSPLCRAMPPVTRFGKGERHGLPIIKELLVAGHEVRREHSGRDHVARVGLEDHMGTTGNKIPSVDYIVLATFCLLLAEVGCRIRWRQSAVNLVCQNHLLGAKQN